MKFRKLSLNLVEDVKLRAIVEVFGEYVLPFIDKAFGKAPLSQGRCIISSMIVMDALLELGYSSAIELPVQVIAVNQKAIDGRKYINENQDLAKEDLDAYALKANEDGAHIVDCGNPMDKQQPGKWAGHLVTLVDGYLIDLTLGQTARPEKCIYTSAVAVPVYDNVDLEVKGSLISRVGQKGRLEVVWLSQPESLKYQQSPNYNPTRRHKIVKKLMVKMRERKII